MNHPKMTIEEIIEYLANDDSFDDFAVRGDVFVPKRNFRKSRYHGDARSRYQLPGVSAIAIMDRFDADQISAAIKRAARYGDNVFLLRGESTNADEITGDCDEVLMVSHRIVSVVE